jgi:chitinase
VEAATQFLRKHNFRGLSLEWNYPGCWQSDCRRGPETDRPNFTKLLAELRREFDLQEPRLTLAVALSGYKEVIDKGYDVAEISKLVDFMTVMTYDYHGAWESRTSHLAPLFPIPGDNTPHYNLVRIRKPTSAS